MGRKDNKQWLLRLGVFLRQKTFQASSHFAPLALTLIFALALALT